jgi:hypothetical protein
MEKEKLSAREAALIAEARREAQARKAGAPPAQAPQAPPAARQPQAPDKPKPSPADRLAQLMAEEHAETERRKKKMRRYGIVIPAAILAVFTLWMVRVFTRRR